jgi:glucose/arabinose dehydrogenase
MLSLSVIASIVALPLALAQSCSNGLSPSGQVRPSIASGYAYQVVATGLADPRGIHFDSEGHLLVVERGEGRVSALTLTEDDQGCITAAQPQGLTDDVDLNHGIEVSPDGRTLYASTSNDAYAWDYDPQAMTTSNRRTIITNMEGSGHSTRTLLLSRVDSQQGWLLASFGSQGNLDIAATEESSGSSSVKAFNLANRSGEYDYPRQGTLMGWGLRNEVGVAEHPISGGIWGIENSADQLERHGVEVWEDNPAEELNYLGTLAAEDEDRGRNFGYPWCFSAWNVDELPENSNIEVGTQFAIDQSSALNNENQTDAFCADRQQSRLVFEAHMAPLDLKFNDSGRQAWIAFHGSWNRPDPAGYKLSVVDFDSDGQPVDDVTSTSAATDVFANQDLSACPGSCFRPVAMAIDGRGRIFLSSDSTGEIYMVSRDEGASGTEGGSSPTSSEAASATSNAAGYLTIPGVAPWLGPAIAMLW